MYKRLQPCAGPATMVMFICRTNLHNK